MNTKLNYGLLKKLYAIHSPSGKEDKMIKFLISYIKSLHGDISLGRDAYGNIYAIKGESVTYPAIVAHLDQISCCPHPRDFKPTETRDLIFGYSSKEHTFCNLGADDKNGIFIILEALKKYDCIKVALFREEECGCNGSNHAEMKFFEDCRFVLQCDRKGNSDLITSIGGTDLCSEAFIQAIDPERFNYIPAVGMMTDVETLKEKGLSVSAVNISCGYYNPHQSEEITVKRDLEGCWKLVQHIIEDCTEVYPHEVGENGYYGFYDEWELESELYDFIQQDPSLTGADLYDMYHTNFPRLKIEDFERIVEEYRLMYGDETEESITPHHTFLTNGKENDKEDYIF